MTLQDKVPKPREFVPARVVTNAHMQLDPPPFITRQRYRGRRAEGVRYERTVQDMLRRRYGECHFRGPWLKFYDNGRLRWCQPDALLIDVLQGRIVIVEVKYQHTLDAWWQLYHLYLPVLRVIFPQGMWELTVCEVVKWYDPATWFPCQVRMLADPTQARVNEFGVHIWKKGN